MHVISDDDDDDDDDWQIPTLLRIRGCCCCRCGCVTSPGHSESSAGLLEVRSYWFDLICFVWDGNRLGILGWLVGGTSDAVGIINTLRVVDDRSLHAQNIITTRPVSLVPHICSKNKNQSLPNLIDLPESWVCRRHSQLQMAKPVNLQSPLQCYQTQTLGRRATISD